MKRAVILVAVAACGGGGASHPDGIQGGSRLEARFLEADGGARIFWGFHDTELDVDCSFWGDPVRCLPWVQSIGAYFADDACTEPVVESPTGPCSSSAPYAGRYASCSTGLLEVWEIGDLVEGALYVESGGTCVEIEPPNGFTYRRLGAEVALDRFVGGTYEIEGSGAVRRRVLHADDGSRLIESLWSAESDRACSVTEGHCVDEHGWAYEYVDDACEVPIGHTNPACPSEPDLIAEYRQEGCEWRVRLFENAGATEPAALYTAFSDACSPQEPSDDDYWAVGDELALDTFPAIDRELEGGRIQAYVYAHDGETVGAEGTLHDGELDVDCVAREVTSGEWRCLPAGIASVQHSFYADPDCTDPAPVAETYGDVCSGPPPRPDRAVDDVAGASCRSTLRLYAAGDEILPGDLYSQDQTGTCTAADWDRATYRRYALGAELDFDDYAVLRLASD